PADLPARSGLLRIGSMGKRILVVDDAADNRRLLRRLLMHGGVDVAIAADGAIGVAAAFPALNDELPLHLIIMDMLMPGLDGYAATRQLRKRGYPGLVVALTAHVSAADEDKCRQAGCDDYIAKPFDCEQLLEKVHSSVRAREMALAAAHS